jgi:hypothetical protein
VIPALRISLLAVRIATLVLLSLFQTRLFYRTIFAPVSAVPQTSYGTFANGKSKPSRIDSKPDKKEPPPPPSLGAYIERIKVLGPYLWPSKSIGLQLIAGQFPYYYHYFCLFSNLDSHYVAFCFALLAVGRVVNIYVPISLKWVVEDLTAERRTISPSRFWRELASYLCFCV